ncbi:MAG: c-type cytochrome [Dehalococcoidia bacterium]|nr:c-type cytochrome [Dehalococcoidia bacterium]
MKRFGFVLIVLLGLVGTLFLAACQKEAPKASPASIANGGQIYDKWWKVVQGAAEPKDNQALWALQTTNTRKGADTWRCKECHGWDYKGKDGAYAKGSHLTGFPGVYDASLNKTKAQLLDALKGKADSRHNFASLLGEAGLNDLATFLKEGVIDETKYIDLSTKKPIGANVAHGKELYSSTCVACHGADGKQILFDGKDSLGFLANDNPWETLHKIRFGQPGAPMPAGVVTGWSIQDAVDVLGHAQTLPSK